MPQDAFTLRFLCEELNTILNNGKVNRVTVSNPDELVLTIFTGKSTQKLYISVNAGSPRIGITHQEKEGLLTATNFCMLVRKHLLNATLKKIELVGFDRIVKIEFESCLEFSEIESVYLYVELMGRYSNIILVKNGKVLGGNRGINMFDDGVRPLFVGKPYVFPPDNGKLLPDDRALIQRLNSYNGLDFAEFLSQNVQGLAKSTSKEIVYRFSEINLGEKCQNNPTRLFEFINRFIYENKKPCIYISDNGIDVFAFPYNSCKTHGEVKFFDFLYQAEEYYYTFKYKQKVFKECKERLLSVINSNLKKIKKRLTAINAKIKEANNLEINRLKGELLTANLYKLKGGEDSIEVDNYYDNTKLVIELDVKLSPSKNAESYYKKYNKQKRTLTATASQKELAVRDLEYFVNLLGFVNLAEDITELTPILAELKEGGYVKQIDNKQKKEKQNPYLLYSVDGFKVKVGRSNVENEQITFSAQPNDTWLHVKDYHSSHVIIETNGKDLPDSVIKTCAEICAYKSPARESGKVEVVFTKRKFVKKVRGGKIGLVTYTDNKTVLVSANRHPEFIVE